MYFKQVPEKKRKCKIKMVLELERSRFKMQHQHILRHFSQNSCILYQNIQFKNEIIGMHICIFFWMQVKSPWRLGTSGIVCQLANSIWMTSKLKKQQHYFVVVISLSQCLNGSILWYLHHIRTHASECPLLAQM